MLHTPSINEYELVLEEAHNHVVVISQNCNLHLSALCILEWYDFNYTSEGD